MDMDVKCDEPELCHVCKRFLPPNTPFTHVLVPIIMLRIIDTCYG